MADANESSIPADPIDFDTQHPNEIMFFLFDKLNNLPSQRSPDEVERLRQFTSDQYTNWMVTCGQHNVLNTTQTNRLHGATPLDWNGLRTIWVLFAQVTGNWTWASVSQDLQQQEFLGFVLKLIREAETEGMSDWRLQDHGGEIADTPPRDHESIVNAIYPFLTN